MKNNIFYAITIAGLIATSCTEKSYIDDIVTEPAVINFEAQLGRQTRAGYLDQNSGFSDGDVIGVFGYQKNATAPWANNELPLLMHNITLTRQTFDDGTSSVVNYVYYPQRLWPNLPNKARFFAYYPHNSSVTTGAITPSPETHAGYPYVEVALGLSHTPIDFVTAQTDLMDRTAGTTGDGVTFTFGHRLSKLFFKVKASGLSTGLGAEETRKMYINQLAVKNIYNKAKYTFYDGTVPINGAWSEHTTAEIDATSGATLLSNSIMAEVGETYQDLIDPHGLGAYLLMIPQISDNIEIEVIYTVERLNKSGGCEDHLIVTRRFPVSVNWQSGKVYTYYLEFGFLEINESAIKLSLSVADWIAGGYDINMGN